MTREQWATELAYIEDVLELAGDATHRAAILRAVPHLIAEIRRLHAEHPEHGPYHAEAMANIEAALDAGLPDPPARVGK